MSPKPIDKVNIINGAARIRFVVAGGSGVSYGVANEVLQMTGAPAYGVNSETRTYNGLFQLTQLTVGSALNIQYAYPATQNNGEITSQTDVISGEQVTYTYDALNRLATAVGSGWGQSYTYDGFGNLTDQNVISGSAPTMHVVYNAATNRQTGDVADANGNIGSGSVYDITNRLLQAGGTTMKYAYDAGNKRIWRGDGQSVNEITFWGSGGRMAAYQISVSSPTVYFMLKTTNVSFGGKLVSKGTGTGWNGCGECVTLAVVAQDRLGSIGKFYPYGQERPSATANDTEKFTGYFRDAATGLDYADQRYHQPGVGRFMTSDPYVASIGPRDPGSWNRYAYTRGDPVNRTDRHGTCDEFVDGDDPCFFEPDFSDGGGPTDGGGSPPQAPIGKSFDQLPCWANQTNIELTFLDMRDNILSIVAHDNFSPDETSALDTTLVNAIVKEEGDIFALLGSPFGGPVNLATWNNLSIFSNPLTKDQFNGGHFVLSGVSIADILNDFGGDPTSKDYQAFVKDFHGRFNGRVQPATSGQAAQHSDYLHSHMRPNDLTFHFDDYPPFTPGHLAVDVGLGHVPGVCLDPAWH